MESEQIQSTPLKEHLSKGVWIIIFVLIFMFIVGIGYGLNNTGYGLDESGESESVAEKVFTAKINTESALGADKLPVGWPLFLPIEDAEMNNITESLGTIYADQGMSLYSVSYTSPSSGTEVYNKWLSYMEGEGYEVVPNEENSDELFLRGDKDGDELTVFVSTDGPDALVQVNYLDRQ